MFLLVGYAIIISLAGEWFPSPATGADFFRGVFLMKTYEIRVSVTNGFDLTLNMNLGYDNVLSIIIMALDIGVNGFDRTDDDLIKIISDLVWSCYRLARLDDNNQNSGKSLCSDWFYSGANIISVAVYRNGVQYSI